MVQNAASDAIVNLWNSAVILGFIPFGYLVADQIDIFYDTFYDTLIFPVANTFVLDFLAPVVDSPLNLSTWVDGLIDVGYAAGVGLINLGISELNYFFGWLIPPIPPIGPLAVGAPPAPPSTDLLDAAALVTDPLVAGNESFFDPVAGVTEDGLGAVKPVRDGLGLDLVNEQIDINCAALKALATEQVGFVSDLISVQDQYLSDVARMARDRWRRSAPKPSSSRTARSPAEAQPSTRPPTTTVKAVKDSQPGSAEKKSADNDDKD